MPWPKPETAGLGVFAEEAPRTRIEVLEPERRLAQSLSAELPSLEPGCPFDKKGHTFLEAVMLGVGDALRADPRVFVYGEDVGGQYGNAFLLLRPLLKEFGDRLINSPLAESAVLGVCVGRGARGAASDRRDAVQRLRRHRLQSAREQRREDPLSLGCERADGRAHALGRPALRRTLPLAEHRSPGSIARQG